MPKGGAAKILFSRPTTDRKGGARLLLRTLLTVLVIPAIYVVPQDDRL